MTEVIGVVGAAGDLGSQMVTQLYECGFEVLENDKQTTYSSSLTRMLKEADIIHFCIPADAVPSFDNPRNVLLLFHDSVMESSHKASIELTGGSAVPVHWLMNDASRVVIGDEYLYTNEAVEHFKALGQAPLTMSIHEHDRLVARSQAPLVILIKELLPDLREWREKGLLTPSAVELLESLESREAHWTAATTKSILKNPEIDVLIDDIQNHRAQDLNNSLLNE